MNKTFHNITERLALKLFTIACKRQGVSCKRINMQTISYDRRNHKGTFRLNTVK